MGSWFSNLHIRKSETVSEASVLECLREMLVCQKYIPVDSEEEADRGFALLTDERSGWYSVFSDCFSFDDPAAYTAYALPMAENLHTDILGISCFDSDYLYLNLIDEKTDAWACVGSAAGTDIKRRTNFKLWQHKVDDYDRFRECMKKEYVCAEEVLYALESCIYLPPEYSTASYAYLAELSLKEKATYLYFKLPETMKKRELPALQWCSGPLAPCDMEQPSIVSFISTGGDSHGLSVFFLGSYVEKEEISFSEVTLCRPGEEQKNIIPVSLQKVQLTDGQWAYYYHDPDCTILAKADERLPKAKRLQVEREGEITLRFVPHGNPRKVLDITVILVPDENPAGQGGWNVWYKYGSKKAYIQFFNNLGFGQPPLREEDYDE